MNRRRHKFFKYNFGLQDRLEKEDLPNHYRNEYFPPENEPTPEKFLRDFAEDQNKYFPIHLCELYSGFPEYTQADRSQSPSNNFCFVIGESLQSWLYLWNRIFLVSSWQRENFTQMWIPHSMLQSEELTESLTRFFDMHYFEFYNNIPVINFVTETLGKDDIQEFMKRIAPARGKVSNFSKLQANTIDMIAPFEEDTPRRSNIHDTQVPAQSLTVHNPFPACLEIPVADESGFRAGKSWMVDLKIQRDESHIRIPSNLKYWWKLPKRNSLVRLFSERQEGRVLSGGYLSLRTSGSISNINLVIPDDDTVIRTTVYEFLPRKQKKKGSGEVIYGGMGLSDKGKYAAGCIGLFPNFEQLYRFVSSKYWREIVLDLCGMGESIVARQLSEIGNKLNKVIPSLIAKYHSDPDGQHKYFARYIFNQAKKLKSKNDSISFAELLQRFIVEREDFWEREKDHYGNPLDCSEECPKEDLRSALYDLTMISVFLQGIKPKCPTCGSKLWYHVEDIGDTVLCRGCRTEFSLPVESVWYYKLNDLVLNAAAFQGIFPLVWAVGHLLETDWECFIYSPSIVFSDKEDYNKTVAEIDLVCIQNGRIAIGEVKPSAREFSDGVLENLAEITRQIAPDEVLLCAFSGDNTQMNAIRDRFILILQDFKTEIKTIHAPEHLFESSYDIFC